MIRLAPESDGEILQNGEDGLKVIRHKRNENWN